MVHAGDWPPEIEGAFWCSAGGIDASSHPIGDLSFRRRLDRALLKLYWNDPACCWTITPPPEAPARDRVDNALYPAKTFAVKSSV
ncbi:MAG: hypothetical protein M2R46_02757 [Verrucomicrobia subdivision 3 bacterium]|nr:hypothetical protein [Limisphaerales bacterium]